MPAVRRDLRSVTGFWWAPLGGWFPWWVWETRQFKWVVVEWDFFATHSAVKGSAGIAHNIIWVLGLAVDGYVWEWEEAVWVPGTLEHLRNPDRSPLNWDPPFQVSREIQDDSLYDAAGVSTASYYSLAPAITAIATADTWPRSVASMEPGPMSAYRTKFNRWVASRYV